MRIYTEEKVEEVKSEEEKVIQVVALDFDGASDGLVGVEMQVYRAACESDMQAMISEQKEFETHLDAIGEQSLFPLIVTCASNRQSFSFDAAIARANDLKRQKKGGVDYRNHNPEGISCYLAYPCLESFAVKKEWTFKPYSLSGDYAEYPSPPILDENRANSAIPDKAILDEHHLPVDDSTPDECVSPLDDFILDECFSPIDDAIPVVINGVTEYIAVDDLSDEFSDFGSLETGSITIKCDHAIKIALVQQQIIELSKEFPDNFIHYRFYDDKSEFFQSIHDHIEVPANVKVSFWHYNWGKRVDPNNHVDLIIPCPDLTINGASENSHSDTSTSRSSSSGCTSAFSALSFHDNTPSPVFSFVSQEEMGLQNQQLPFLGSLFQPIKEKSTIPVDAETDLGVHSRPLPDEESDLGISSKKRCSREGDGSSGFFVPDQMQPW